MNKNITVGKGHEAAQTRETELRTILPEVNVYENNEEILLQVEMPGAERDGIHINLDNGKLAIAARRKGAGGTNPIYTEFGPVAFHRAFSVPQSINPEKVHAEFSNGVLDLHLPKSEAFKPRTIEVREG